MIPWRETLVSFSSLGKYVWPQSHAPLPRVWVPRWRRGGQISRRRSSNVQKIARVWNSDVSFKFWRNGWSLYDIEQPCRYKRSMRSLLVDLIFAMHERSQKVPHKLRWQDQQGECPKQAFADDLAEHWAKRFIFGRDRSPLCSTFDVGFPNISNLTMVFWSALAHFLYFTHFDYSFQAKQWKKKRHETPSRNWPLCGATSRRWGRQPMSFRIVVYDGLWASRTVEQFSKSKLFWQEKCSAS